MGNILTAEVILKGTRPLWWHHFGPEALPLEKQERVGVAGNNPEEWRHTILVMPTGQLYVDATQVFASIREGGRYVTKKRGSIMPDIAATLQVTEDRILLDRWFPGYPREEVFDILKEQPPETNPELPIFMDIRGVRNPTTKARNVRYRVAASAGWRMRFLIQWDKTVVARVPMETAILEAGRFVGIGNGRSIGMGRYTLEQFDISE